MELLDLLHQLIDFSLGSEALLSQLTILLPQIEDLFLLPFQVHFKMPHHIELLPVLGLLLRIVLVRH